LAVHIDDFESLRKKLKLPATQSKNINEGNKRLLTNKKSFSVLSMEKNINPARRPKPQPKGNVKPNKPISPRKPVYPKEKPNIPLDKNKSNYLATLQNVARYYSIFVSDIIKLLRESRIEDLKDDSLLSKTEFEWVKRKMNSDKIWKSRRIPLPNYVWTQFREESDPVPIPPSSEIPKLKPTSPEEIPSKIIQISLTRNVFSNLIKSVGYKSLILIQSHFENLQARLICSRMSSSYARSIAEKHSSAMPGEDMELLVYQLHYMANKAFQVFGGKILTLIYELPPLQFAQKTAQEVLTYKKVRPDFPLISFTMHQMQVNVAFFTRLHQSQNKLQPHVILFKHKTYETIGSIDALGHIHLQLQKFSPQLSLFIDRINEKQFKIYSGVQTGVCDICQRPLTHPLSLRIGIGPVCASNIGLDRSVYES